MSPRSLCLKAKPPRHNLTVPRVMFNSLRDEIDPVITVVSTYLVVVSVTIVLVVQLANRKSQQ